MTTPDTLINSFDNALRTVFAKPRPTRPCPTVAGDSTVLTAPDKALAGALMRVNHVGEVCAQALYAAQALTTQDPALRKQFIEASREEGDHLAWTAQRLDSHRSRARHRHEPRQILLSHHHAGQNGRDHDWV